MTARGIATTALALLAWPVAAPAQPADGVAALRAALEGRQVTVKIDMPATAGGVDLYPQREPDIAAEAYGLRLKDAGVAIPRDTRVPITLIKVNAKNIEVHLAGGGYGTRSDPFLIPPTRAYVPPSARERNLEDDRDRTTDPGRKRQIEQELARLAAQRAEQEMVETRRREVDYELKKSEIAVKRLGRGSRFNVWYPDKRLERWVPTAEDLMQALATYVDFGDPRLRSVTKGMSAAEVYGVLGFPSRRRPSREGDFESSVETWETRRDVLEVTFVDGVAVRITSAVK